MLNIGKNKFLVKFEEKIRYTLPSEYRKFILNLDYNETEFCIFKENKKLGIIVLNNLYSLQAIN